MTTSAKFSQQALDRIVRKQRDVISRRQALSVGMTPAALRHRLRPHGPWQRLLPGIYLTVTGAPTQIHKETAAYVYAGGDSVITGLTALRKLGIRTPATATITVLIPAGRARRSREFVVVRPTIRMPDRVFTDGAVTFAEVPRAVVDAARDLTSFRETRALVADAVQQSGCPVGWLSEELAHAPVRHSAWLRRAVAEVADGVRSVAEGDLLSLIKGAGLPTPECNVGIYLGRELIGVADAWWPGTNVIAEVDSRAWHFSADEWERTLSRTSRLGACGLVVLHFTPRQVREDRQSVVATIRTALGRAGQMPAGVRAVAQN
jgi:hypothetical protein